MLVVLLFDLLVCFGLLLDCLQLVFVGLLIWFTIWICWLIACFDCFWLYLCGPFLGDLLASGFFGCWFGVCCVLVGFIVCCWCVIGFLCCFSGFCIVGLLKRGCFGCLLFYAMSCLARVCLVITLVGCLLFVAVGLFGIALFVLLVCLFVVSWFLFDYLVFWLWCLLLWFVYCLEYTCWRVACLCLWFIVGCLVGLFALGLICFAWIDCWLLCLFNWLVFAVVCLLIVYVSYSLCYVYYYYNVGTVDLLFVVLVVWAPIGWLFWLICLV